METIVSFTVEVTADMRADADKCDYGVPGSPTWYEPANHEVVSLEIDGFKIPLDCLPKDVREYLEERAYEASLESEWTR